jgi:hypothetical protein
MHHAPLDAPVPYLSIVVTSRNDDHGGKSLQRLQAFINGLLNQCEEHQLSAELIVVEWNPPDDRPRLARALGWPDKRSCGVRIIEVPVDLHSRMRHSESLPLYQMIAKNVGIRRARGHYVLATNIDILFSDQLIRFLPKRQLEANTLYRIDRWDVLAGVPVNASLTEQIDYCRSHLIRLNRRDHTLSVTPDGLQFLGQDGIVQAESASTLG